MLVIALAAVAFWWTQRGFHVAGTDDMSAQLQGRGVVLVLGAQDLLTIPADDATLVAADSPSMTRALQSQDEDALITAMNEAGARAILVEWSAPTDPPELTNQARLQRYDAFAQLGCVYLTPRVALYELRDALQIPPLLSGALAHVARVVVAGGAVPRVQSFPEPLRRIHNVEVMVLLSQGGTPRLWRSARGSSIARALLTAAVVARQRWNERETAMGGPLARVLPTLDVRVDLLDEDGTLSARDQPFIERAFSPAHGVAYEHRGNWHYLLPEATRERGEGSSFRAYTSLLHDGDLPPEGLQRGDLRLYRSLARVVAESPAPSRGGGTDSLAP